MEQETEIANFLLPILKKKRNRGIRILFSPHPIPIHELYSCERVVKIGSLVSCWKASENIFAEEICKSTMQFLEWLTIIQPRISRDLSTLWKRRYAVLKGSRTTSFRGSSLRAITYFAFQRRYNVRYFDEMFLNIKRVWKGRNSRYFGR